MTMKPRCDLTLIRDKVVEDFRTAVATAHFVQHPNAAVWDRTWVERVVNEQPTRWISDATANIRGQINCWLKEKEHATRQGP